VAGFDLTFSPSKSVSTAWALADAETKARIYDCHRRAIEVVLTYAEREVFCSRSGTGGVLQEDIEGVVAAAFTHWDSRSWDPQLHDHVVVSNRARSVSDGTWRTLDGRALFKNVVTLSELHQGANRPPFGPRFAVVRRPPASAVRLML
jgi:conjugative relaxase-like TrwC/TraI family protein